MNTITRQQIINIYKDWLNNFVTIEKFAEHYGFSVKFAEALIAEGKEQMLTSEHIQEIKNNTFDNALKEWKKRVEEKFQVNLEISPNGKRFIKIINNTSQPYVYCFIERENGNVLKPATWRAPAKHARGNIYVIGKEGVNSYGGLYLK